MPVCGRHWPHVMGHISRIGSISDRRHAPPRPAPASGPLRDHLASSLLTAVGTGDIPLGTRLPAERRLADALGVSRGTVVAALDQLVDRGVVERRPGSGSYVRAAPVTAVRSEHAW